jgi:hypothetical protein
VTQIIRPETPNLKKPWSSIFNQSNIKGWNREKQFSTLQKYFKITLKRMMIKIEKINKFYIWLKGEIEKKNQFSKRIKNQKNEDQIWKKNKNNILIEWWNWKK